MDCDGSTSCPCDIHVARRMNRVLDTHPIHSQKGKPIQPSLIPPDQALAMWLGIKEDAKEMLAKAKNEILILKDCAKV